jgi:sugar lactone lactonase YvrE
MMTFDHQSLFAISVSILLCLSAHAQYQIDTVIGNGHEGYSGDAGDATEAQITHAHGLAVDRDGNLYIADTENRRVRKVDIKTGIITTVAGGGESEPSDGKKAIEVQLNMPNGVAIDKADHLYILDQANYRVYKVDTQGIITLVAGDGHSGYSGDGGPATKAQIRPYLGAISVDNKGNLYIADRLNHCIRQIKSQTITTVAGICTQEGYTGDGDLATTAKLSQPADVKVDKEGNLYIADTHNHVIRKVDTKGIITTIAGNGKNGYGGDGKYATAAKLNEPAGIALDNRGNLYIADFKNHRIRQLNQKTGIITTIAGNGAQEFNGDGGFAKEASFNLPEALHFNQTGTVLYVSDKFNYRVRKLKWVASPNLISILLLLSGLALLLGIAFYYYRLYHHPIVQTLSADTSQLLTIPLEQLTQAKSLLKGTHRLDTVLANNEVPTEWLDNAINFATMPNVERCAMLANRLSSTVEPVTDEIFKLYLNEEFPFRLTSCLLYFPQADLAAQDVIMQLKRDEMNSQVTIVISLVPTQQEALRPEGENRANQWVVPNNRELTTLLLSPKPIEVFAHLLASQMEVTNLSPYQTGAGVTKDSAFFGREKILKQVINRDPMNYLFIGGRQLGKSSLLKKIERHYRNHPKIACFYFSLRDDSLRRLNMTLGLAKDAPLSALLDKLVEIPTGERRLILIDEADRFIRSEIAEAYPTLSKFRSVSEEGGCHFILAGFWDLYEAAVLDYQSPIVNFGESIIVGALETKACRDLATEPMARLGIRYASEDLVEQIITATGQRANFVAIVCDEMLQNLPSDRRVLNQQDVTRALHSEAIEQALGAWRQLSRGDEQAARLDRIIVWATVESGEFSLTDVMSVLNKRDYVYTTEQLNQSLKRLELAYIIRREKSRYSYCVPLFREWLLEQEVGALLEQEFKIC